MAAIALDAAHLDEGRGAVRSADADSEARRLVGQFADFIWRCLRRLGVGDSHIDDATQAVFLIAWKKMSAITPGRERAYLFGIALNVAAHARRTQARRRCELASSSTDEDPAPGPSPEAELDRKQARQILERVLDSMPMDLRAVFVLFELEELTTKEIADLLELPPGTVASRLRRAREEFSEVARRERVRAGSRGTGR